MTARHRSRLATGLVAVAVLAGALAAGSSGANPTARLRLDGVEFRPELALSPSSRSLGLMHRRKAPVDGMLFVFPQDTTGSFWMMDTLVPLRIVFFNAKGIRVRQLFMTPCRTESCRTYNPGRVYRFALELPASDRRPTKKLGPLGELRRLGRLSS